MTDNIIITDHNLPDQPKPQRHGGLAVVQKYGRDHMARLGRRGYQTTCDRYFAGDRDAMNKWLSARGLYELDKGYATWGFNYFKDPGPHPAHL